MCGTTKALLIPCGVSPIKNDMHIYRGNVYRGYCVHINTVYIKGDPYIMSCISES